MHVSYLVATTTEALDTVNYFCLMTFFLQFPEPLEFVLADSSVVLIHPLLRLLEIVS